MFNLGEIKKILLNDIVLWNWRKCVRISNIQILNSQENEDSKLIFFERNTKLGFNQDEGMLKKLLKKKSEKRNKLQEKLEC